MDEKDALERLNAEDRADRLASLTEIVAADVGAVSSAPLTGEVNNHVHTKYSFSPYSPSAVAWSARRAGLAVVGSVDHDSISAAGEMRLAAERVGMGATVGAELRVSFANTPFAERRLNNPDTIGNAYIVLHGVPRASWGALDELLARVRRAREVRNRQQVDRLNRLLPPRIGVLDYERDIRARSWAGGGGTVTERHILFALAHRLLEIGDGVPERALAIAEEVIDAPVADTAKERICEPFNPHAAYDLLGLLKANLVSRFFIQPSPEESPAVVEITALAASLGAIPAYAYLGDVAGSVTGDKKDQSFEDAYLDELFEALPGLGFQAVTYMPPRNTGEQLESVQRLCATHALMEISGVDINSSRQSFHCPEVLEPQFRHLIESTWALVGHEAANGPDAVDRGIFGACATGAGATLAERIDEFARLGRRSVHGGEGATGEGAAGGAHA